MLRDDGGRGRRWQHCRRATCNQSQQDVAVFGEQRKCAQDDRYYPDVAHIWSQSNADRVAWIQSWAITYAKHNLCIQPTTAVRRIPTFYAGTEIKAVDDDNPLSAGGMKAALFWISTPLRRHGFNPYIHACLTCRVRETARPARPKPDTASFPNPIRKPVVGLLEAAMIIINGTASTHANVRRNLPEAEDSRYEYSGFPADECGVVLADRYFNISELGTSV
ncbi:hypothetical protein B0H14DRAFT_2657990 [Mycena olivaceomarginata]|nr:hypothetical protein B0H14DRAFT_2657990 [Mycena olivaceomarginata]